MPKITNSKHRVARPHNSLNLNKFNQTKFAPRLATLSCSEVAGQCTDNVLGETLDATVGVLSAKVNFVLESCPGRY